jgi:hypothetical protein
VPTHPELRINYLERVWPKKEIKRMYKSEEFDKEQEDSDPDRKLFAAEQRKAQMEKKILWAVWGAAVLAWFFLIQDWMLTNIYDKNGKFLEELLLF